MKPTERTAYRDEYRDGLLKDTIPFWLKHGIDREKGGVFTGLGRDGVVIDTDKAVWPQGRFAWMLATLYNTIEDAAIEEILGLQGTVREEWLAGALSCLEFLEEHAFDDDGRMFFLLTDDGRPVRKRRYAFSEAFAAQAFAACARATGNDAYASRAIELFHTFTRCSIDPGTIPPKVDPETRPSKGLGPLMIGMHLSQVLRDTIGFDDADRWIDRCIEEIRRDFMKPEHRAVLELVSPDGGIIDHFDGRLLNPRHAIEAAWFILHEAKHRGGDTDLIETGVTMLDWMWERGWDWKHGGLFYYRDLLHKPIQEYWHDMKFWWPHNEAIIATLLAYELTGDPRHAERHARVHAWAHEHFRDLEHGEWYGYLHRDGRISSDLKGNHWKGPFHLPRMQWYCWQLLDGPN